MDLDFKKKGGGLWMESISCTFQKKKKSLKFKSVHIFSSCLKNIQGVGHAHASEKICIKLSLKIQSMHYTQYKGLK